MVHHETRWNGRVACRSYQKMLPHLSHLNPHHKPIPKLCCCYFTAQASAATSTPRYRILPSFSFCTASCKPASVSANVSICGLMWWCAAKASISLCTPREATNEEAKVYVSKKKGKELLGLVAEDERRWKKRRTESQLELWARKERRWCLFVRGHLCA